MFKFVIILLLLLNVTNANEFLKQIHILFRHGQRTPTETYKNDPYINYTWSGGWGQLTNVGKYQMYLLGQEIRNKYNDFIPKYYTNYQIKVLSSYADRCLMSMEVFLAGFYPPEAEQIWNTKLLWQPIPVQYQPRNQDNFLAMKQKCDTYDKALKETINSSYITELNTVNRDLYDYLTNYTGILVNNISTVELLYNTLEIELLHNLTLPLWTQNLSFSRMKDLGARSLGLYTYSDFMKKMKGGIFLSKTINNMKNFVTNNSKFKVHLYCAHDLTIVNILRTLGVFDQIKPDFGATLIIELHNKTNYEVKMFYKNGYNEEYEELFLSECKSSCTLTNYEMALKNVLPTNWEEECQI